MSEFDSLFDAFVGEDAVTSTTERPSVDAVLDENKKVEQLLKDEREHELSAEKIAAKLNNSRVSAKDEQDEPRVQDSTHTGSSSYGSSSYSYAKPSYSSNGGERPREKVYSSSRQDDDDEYENTREEYKERAAEKRYKRKMSEFGKKIYHTVDQSPRKKRIVEDDIFDMQLNEKNIREAAEKNDGISPFEPTSFKSKLKLELLKLSMAATEIVGKAMYAQKSNIPKPVEQKTTTTTTTTPSWRR